MSSDPPKPSGAIVSHPLVVLGVPAYNEVRWIERTLRSIQSQTHAEFRVLISDNASTDGTSDVCEQFARSDPRFIHVRHPENRGASTNFSFAHEHSSSRYFGWVAAHDLLHPDYLSCHLKALEGQPSAACSFTYFEWIDALDRTIRLDGDVGIAAPQASAWIRYLWSIAIGSDLGPMHGLFRRSTLPVPSARPVAAGDLVLMAFVSHHGSFIAQPGHLYRLRDFAEGRGVDDMMQRITGRSGVAGTFDATVAAYLADFDLLHPPGTRGHRMRPLISWLLHDRLDRRSLRVTKRIRSLAKRMHDLRAWLRPTPTDQR